MIMANVYWRGAMLVLLLVLIPLLVGGCATTSDPPTTEQLLFRTEAVGYTSVWAAMRFGDVNTLELQAVLPIVQDARAALETDTVDRPVVITRLLFERLRLDESLDPTDAQFIREGITGLLAHVDATYQLDPKAEQTAIFVAAFLKGVERGIVAATNVPKGS